MNECMLRLCPGNVLQPRSATYVLQIQGIYVYFVNILPYLVALKLRVWWSS